MSDYAEKLLDKNKLEAREQEFVETAGQSIHHSVLVDCTPNRHERRKLAKERRKYDR